MQLLSFFNPRSLMQPNALHLMVMSWCKEACQLNFTKSHVPGITQYNIHFKLREKYSQAHYQKVSLNNYLHPVCKTQYITCKTARIPVFSYMQKNIPLIEKLCVATCKCILIVTISCLLYIKFFTMLTSGNTTFCWWIVPVKQFP